MKKVYVFLAEGFEEIEAMAPVDILKRAGATVVLVSVTGNTVVRSTRGVGVVADMLIEQLNGSDASMMILPGGQPGADHLNGHEKLKAMLREASGKGVYIAAICAAPLVLGGLGLLQGRKATCYPGVEPFLKGATVTGMPVEVDGNFITSKGPGTAIRFALKLVEILFGKAKADELRQKMLIDEK